MGRKRVYPPLDVFMNSRRVGQLSRDADGAFVFSYAAEWLSWKNAMPVSLSLPLRQDRYRGPEVFAVFDNLLPDSDLIRRRVAERVGAEGLDAHSLLAKIGRDCVGALQFLPAGEMPTRADQLSGEPLTEAAIANILRNLGQVPLGLEPLQDFRISVAGAQEKTALLLKDGAWIKPHGTTPTTHIFKPAIGRLANGLDLADSVENEHFCLRLLAEFGLPVAQTAIERFEDVKVLVVTRFDRLWARDGRLLRLPQEDCCQALSVPPTRKYQSDGGPGIVEIANLLRGSDAALPDRKVFFTTVILFWLLAATDGHAKNFSIFLRPFGQFGLTPLYDVVSLEPSLGLGQLQSKHLKLAMRAGRSRYYRVVDLTGRHFVETGKAAGFSPEQIAEVFLQIESRASSAFEVASRNLEQQSPHIADAVALVSKIRSGFEQQLPRLMGGLQHLG